MAFPVTDAQKAALLGSHEMSARVVAFRGGTMLGEIPASDVAISATLRTQGGRDGAMRVPQSVITSGFLNPLSDQVIVYTGIKDWFEVPIFTGRVDTLNEYSDGDVQVTLLSRGGEAIRAQFEVPWAAINGTQARVEIARILRDVDASWGVDYTDAAPTTIPPGLVWEVDRGQALDQLAQAASLIWQPDRSGGFRVYDNPYAIGPALGAFPVVTIRDGVRGTTVTVNNASSRDVLYNSVTVVTERVDNTEPIRVTVRDTDPGSDTFWGGTFGKQNLVVKNQVPLDIAQCQSLAARILRQSLALIRTFEITCPHMPILDPGDVFTLVYQDVVYSLVVEMITYSYDAQLVTSISARELRSLGFVEMFT
jgi:hypothetical protein